MRILIIEYDKEGAVSGVVDSDTISAAYFMLCDAMGITRPTGILE